MIEWAIYGAIWALQLAALVFFHFSIRHRTRQCRQLSRWLFDAHGLLLKSRDVLRACEGFDARYTADQINEHLQANWTANDMSEQDFLALQNARRRQVYDNGS